MEPQFEWRGYRGPSTSSPHVTINKLGDEGDYSIQASPVAGSTYDARGNGWSATAAGAPRDAQPRDVSFSACVFAPDFVCCSFVRSGSYTVPTGREKRGVAVIARVSCGRH